MDRNNKPPLWEQQVYGPIYVKENAPQGEIVTSVRARFVERHVTYCDVVIDAFYDVTRAREITHSLFSFVRSSTLLFSFVQSPRIEAVKPDDRRTNCRIRRLLQKVGGILDAVHLQFGVCLARLG